ncbi:hypothetical protein LEP1GSC050_1656 [Leptospira broomii serovar Hurstbridge str. 5399]|uniref:Dienelactone hydrolase family protein n=1 Tax=Leptospira broomii serovar Hurstbridge str. 5399 TaxID=1049789 RepID=T0F6U8_9LEPT|nr:hypothetical protein [Leptospira broomii]EQA43247.1 hypothetical protein LEP1GSC050_1656 [Leptospira broomii serovar Hurstbridge str. 5399]
MIPKPKIESTSLSIPVHLVSLDANLDIPDGATKLTLLVEGATEKLGTRSGMHFHRLRNKLHLNNIATLSLDSLLTVQERSISLNEVDTNLLKDRLLTVANWIRGYDKTKKLKLFCCVSYDAATYVLKAAIENHLKIEGIISISGDLDGFAEKSKVAKLDIPMLLIFGGFDFSRIEKNKQLFIEAEKQKREMEIVQLSSGLFTEEKKWDEAMDKISRWLNTIRS